MRINRRFKLNIDLPSSSQSDIAFLLIIFFIITAIFFERTGIIFRLPSKTKKQIILNEDQFIKIEVYNEKLILQNRYISYKDFFNNFNLLKNRTKMNTAVIYFSDDLKYGNYIKIFQNIKRSGNMKISIKPLKEE